jgi:hypothetical protein
LEYPQGTTAVPQITAATTTNASATKVITQSSAIPGTATVLVTSQNGLVTKTYTVNYVVSGPNVAAPTPPARAATDVISMFSNAYANIPIDAWSAVWDDSSISDIQVAGNDTKKLFSPISWEWISAEPDIISMQLISPISIWISGSIIVWIW